MTNDVNSITYHIISQGFLFSIADVTSRQAIPIVTITNNALNNRVNIIFTSLSLSVYIISYFLLSVNSFFQIFLEKFCAGGGYFFHLTINIILQLREKFNRQFAQRFAIKIVEIAY